MPASRCTGNPGPRCAAVRESRCRLSNPRRTSGQRTEECTRSAAGVAGLQLLFRLIGARKLRDQRCVLKKSRRSTNGMVVKTACHERATRERGESNGGGAARIQRRFRKSLRVALCLAKPLTRTTFDVFIHSSGLRWSSLEIHRIRGGIVEAMGRASRRPDGLRSRYGSLPTSMGSSENHKPRCWRTAIALVEVTRCTL